MMIEKVMIQLGVKNLKSSCRMMIEKVVIQKRRIERGGGGGHQRGTCNAEDAGSQGQKPTNQLGKQGMRKANSRKPPKGVQDQKIIIYVIKKKLSTPGSKKNNYRIKNKLSRLGVPKRCNLHHFRAIARAFYGSSCKINTFQHKRSTRRSLWQLQFENRNFSDTSAVLSTNLASLKCL